MTLSLFNVRRPLTVIGYRVHAQPEDLGVSLGELRLESRHVTKFSGAHGSEIFRMGKQDCPAVADPLVKVDRALRGFSGKVGGCVVDT